MTQKRKLLKFISVEIDRHADFGGVVLADLPDTPYNRKAYAGKIVKQWQEYVTAD